MTHEVTIVGSTIRTPRLHLRPWRQDDAAGALDIYGSPEVSRWLAPAMGRVIGLDQMRAVISGWIATPPGPEGRPSGRWVIEETQGGRVAGSGQILPLPPEGDDLELGYQLAPWAWGRGLAARSRSTPFEARSVNATMDSRNTARPAIVSVGGLTDRLTCHNIKTCASPAQLKATAK